MHRQLSSQIRSLRSPALRRLVALVLGALGVLVLSGSQSLNPASALNQPNQGAEPGSLTVVSPTLPGLPSGPTPYPTATLALANALPTGGPVTGPYGVTSPSDLTASGIPAAAQQAYMAAAAELARTDPSCGLNWTLIAGIGRVESNHGRYGGSTIGADGIITPPILGIRLDGSKPGTARISDSDNGVYDGDTAFDRAVGPMQFLPGTWKTYGAGTNPQNMNASALATAKYLCAGDGNLATQAGRWAAVYRYNHSDSYVSLVLSLADSYATGNNAPFPTRPVGTTPPATTEPPATPPGPPPSVPAPPATTPPPPVSPTGVPSPTGAPTPSPTGVPIQPTTTTAPLPPTTDPTTDPPTTQPTTTEPTTAPPTTTTAAPTPTPTPTCTTAAPAPTPTATPTPGCQSALSSPTATPAP